MSNDMHTYVIFGFKQSGTSHNLKLCFCMPTLLK